MKIPSRRETSPGSQLLWVLGAAAAGFATSALFASVLELPRNLFLLPYTAIVIVFTAAYVKSSGLDLGAHFRQRPLLGLVGALVAGSLVVANVLSQPTSPGPEGGALVAAVLWAGVVYGVVDALLLSVVPVVAVFLGLQRGGRIATSLLALAASLLVTAAYHLGYAEFRGAEVIGPIIGNAILSAAYLLTGSPLAATLAHVAMHVAAVLHGMETTVQLPPHY